MKHAVIAAMFVLSACGPLLVAGYWEKPGGTDQEFQRDRYQCMRENTRTQVGVAGVFGQTEEVTEWHMVAMCLQSKGWRKQ